MTNNLIKNQKSQILDLLDNAVSIGIIVGENQTLDTMSAALGLYLVLESEGKNVQIVSKKDPTVEVSNLFGVDRVSKSFDGQTKILTISVPYKEGEIEKVSYNIEEDRLNVNLFAEEGGITFSEKDVEYLRKGSSPSLIITIGVKGEAEINSLVDIKSVKTIHIDRNPLNTLIGDVTIIDPSFSSISEIVTGVVMDYATGLDADAYQNLMDGIAFATKNFTLPATSPFAFEAAGFLLQNGAKRKQGQEESSNKAKQDNNFPSESHFLNQNSRPNMPLRNPQSRTTDQIQANPANRLQNNQSPRIPQQMTPVSAPKEVASETKDMPDEMQFTEGSGSTEIPDDWFLPKVFKGSKKGN